MTILNLTQHQASEAQISAGVVEPDDKQIVKDLLTINELPSREELAHRANQLAAYAAQHGTDQVMIGGAPFLMSQLEQALLSLGLEPLYAFSVRAAVEVDGVKKSIFRHIGFVGV